jgi:hypothetical protein
LRCLDSFLSQVPIDPGYSTRHVHFRFLQALPGCQVYRTRRYRSEETGRQVGRRLRRGRRVKDVWLRGRGEPRTRFMKLSHLFDWSLLLISFQTHLDGPPQLKLQYFPGHVNKEIAVLHMPTKTLVEADLYFNLPPTEQYSKTSQSSQPIWPLSLLQSGMKNAIPRLTGKDKA